MGEGEKYSFVINTLDTNTTHGKILKNVREGSYVLEMGCASGYMTQFMHDKLGCMVDVVEVDNDCIRKAIEFAHDGYAGDIDDDGWYDYFKCRKYDHIIFADVLEHLYNPINALRRAKELLKDTGTIIISIPNICHNDILIRMYHDDWRYSNMGLLDNTHIRFWGWRNISEFIFRAGLITQDVDALKVKTQGTEQRYSEQVEPELLEVLKKRPYGEIYQYVFVCGGKE